MIPEGAGEGTVLEGSEEFIERGEMGYVYRTLLCHAAYSLCKFGTQMRGRKHYGRTLDLLNIKRRLRDCTQFPGEVMLREIHS